MSSISVRYMGIIGNIAPQAPLDLDAFIGASNPTCLDDVPQSQNSVPPSAALWAQPDADASYIGIRVTSQVASLEQLAVSLSAIAVEKQVIPIFISWIGDCGLQRFGLRVEHVSAKHEADALISEAHLKRLWNLAVIIDAADVSAI